LDHPDPEYRQQELIFRPDISVEQKEEPFLVITLMLSSVKFINEICRRRRLTVS
jgi:hypothetical protein